MAKKILTGVATKGVVKIFNVVKKGPHAQKVLNVSSVKEVKKRSNLPGVGQNNENKLQGVSFKKKKTPRRGTVYTYISVSPRNIHFVSIARGNGGKSRLSIKNSERAKVSFNGQSLKVPALGNFLSTKHI
ncbi:hypothetical protein Bca4012_026121 [Brassica carinata]